MGKRRNEEVNQKQRDYSLNHLTDIKEIEIIAVLVVSEKLIVLLYLTALVNGLVMFKSLVPNESPKLSNMWLSLFRGD